MGGKSTWRRAVGRGMTTHLVQLAPLAKHGAVDLAQPPLRRAGRLLRRRHQPRLRHRRREGGDRRLHRREVVVGDDLDDADAARQRRRHGVERRRVGLAEAEHLHRQVALARGVQLLEPLGDLAGQHARVEVVAWLAWMVKRSKIVDLDGLWLTSCGLLVGSEVLGISSPVRRAAPSLQMLSDELLVASHGATKTPLWPSWLAVCQEEHLGLRKRRQVRPRRLAEAEQLPQRGEVRAVPLWLAELELRRRRWWGKGGGEERER